MTILDSIRFDLYGENYDPKSFKYTNMFGPDIKTICLKKAPLNAVINKYLDLNQEILDKIPLNETLELTTLYFAINLKKLKTFDEQMKFLDKKIKYAKSWAITDCLSQFLKKQKREVFNLYFKKWSKSQDLYKKRFAFVNAMKFYKDDDIKIFLDAVDNDDHYYVMMAEAWFLATAAITHKNEVLILLKQDKYSATLRRKTISKISDSFRISEKHTEEFKQIRSLIA